MTATAKRKRARPEIVIARATWPEAEVVNETAKQASDPVVIVRRRQADIAGPNGEEFFVVRGAGTHISLFTGCGGMDLGCEMAGFMTCCQHELDQSACDTLLANRPRYFRHSALIQGDIRKTPTSMILGEAGLRVGECDLITGGPPCQGFSTAGKRQPDDVRNTLVFEFLRVVSEAQPKFFTMENVPGFVTMAGNSFLRDFLALAHASYYELVYGLVNAVQHGVPQDRVRFFCMGTRRDIVEIEGKLGSLPRPTFFDKAELRRIAEARALGEDYSSLVRAPGIRYFHDRELLIPPRPTSKYEGAHNGLLVAKGYQEFFDRLAAEEPDRIVEEPINDSQTYDDHITVWEAIGDPPEP